MVLCLSLSLPYLAISQDDTYIFLTFARNMLEGHGMSFNAGQPTYGFTSVGWLLLLYVSGLVSPNTYANAKALSCVFGMLSLLACHLFACEISGNRRLARWATCAWALNPILLTGNFMGMESTLASCLVLTGLWTHARERRTGTRPLILTAALYSITYLTRPEALLLLVIGAVDATYLAVRGRNLWRLAMYVGVCALIVGAWLLSAQVQFGTIIPNPVHVKALQAARIYSNSPVTLRLLLTLLSVAGADFAIILAALAFMGIARAPRLLLANINSGPRGWFPVVPLVWVLGVLGAYVVEGVEISPRYLSLVLPVITIFASWLLFSVADIVPRRNVAATLVLAGLLYGGQTATANAFVYFPHAQSYIAKDEILRHMADWISENTDPCARVAAIDIGILGFYGHRNIVDLTGLINPDRLKAPTTRSFLRSQGVTYLLDRSPVRNELYLQDPHPSDVQYLPLRYETAPSSGWSAGFVEEGQVGFTLYRLAWR